jgi:hypothetical protein
VAEAAETKKKEMQAIEAKRRADLLEEGVADGDIQTSLMDVDEAIINNTEQPTAEADQPAAKADQPPVTAEADQSETIIRCAVRRGLPRLQNEKEVKVSTHAASRYLSWMDLQLLEIKDKTPFKFSVDNMIKLLPPLRPNVNSLFFFFFFYLIPHFASPSFYSFLQGEFD